MRRSIWCWAAAAAFIVLASSAAAQDFATRLDSALAKWRMATWYSRTENESLAVVELGAFRDRWTDLSPATPTSPYDRDPAWRSVLDQVEQLAGQAAEALERSDAEAGARALDRIGDALAASRERAGAVAFADFVARYRRAIEGFGAAIAAGHMEDGHRAALRLVGATLTLAVAALLPNAPPPYRDASEFQTLVKQNAGAVATLVAAIERPARPTLELEMLGLWHVVRANYNLLFMRYG